MIRDVCRASLAFLLVAGLAGCAEEPEQEAGAPRPVRAIKVGDAEAFFSEWLPGRARAAQEVDLSFRVGGPLIERPVNVGVDVEAGTLVARIDPRDFEVDLREAEGQLDRANAALSRAQSDLDRLLRIQKEDPGATSPVAVDKAREERDGSRAAIKSSEANVAGAKDRLGYTRLEAPFAGRIVTTYVENFQSVRVNQPIVRLLDTRRVKFDVDVPERFISLIPTTSDLRVEFDAFRGKELPAEIFEIGTEASRTTRTYRVTLILDQPEGFKILAGMAGRATGDEPPAADESRDLVVPVSAVFSPDRGETSYVWVIDESSMSASKREVKARRLTDKGIVVEEGLEPGELVATAGVHFIEEGQQLRLLEDEAVQP